MLSLTSIVVIVALSINLWRDFQEVKALPADPAPVEASSMPSVETNVSIDLSDVSDHLTSKQIEPVVDQEARDRAARAEAQRNQELARQLARRQDMERIAAQSEILKLRDELPTAGPPGIQFAFRWERAQAERNIRDRLRRLTQDFVQKYGYQP